MHYSCVLLSTMFNVFPLPRGGEFFSDTLIQLFVFWKAGTHVTSVIINWLCRGSWLKMGIFWRFRWCISMRISQICWRGEKNGKLMNHRWCHTELLLMGKNTKWIYGRIMRSFHRRPLLKNERQTCVRQHFRGFVEIYVILLVKLEVLMSLKLLFLLVMD